MAASVDVDAIVSQVDRKIKLLEDFTVSHRLNGSSLPPLPSPRVYKNNRALHNALEATLVRIENIAASLPRVVSTGRSHIHAKTINYDPGELFQRELNAPMQQLRKAATEISKLTKEFGPACSTILEQTVLLEVSVKAEAALISRASKMPKPSDPKSLKQECQELIDSSADAAELKYDIDTRSPLHNHAMALADASAALGWVVAPASLKHARDYKSIVTTLSEDILSRYIELGCNPVHSDFAESLNAAVEALVTYVEKEHPAGLRWNYAQGATPLGYRRARRNMRKDSHPIGDFYKLLHGGLTEFILVSRELGGVLNPISQYTQGAYEEMAKVIETAAGKSRPHGDVEASLRMLLMSVQHELTPLIAILDRVPKEDRYAQHSQVFREFINIMQWCTATVQKMSTVGYIIDIEAITLLYLAKLEKEFSNHNSYLAHLNHRWTNSLRKMMSEMKEYVKMHHPNELMFDSQRTRKSIDALLKSASLARQLEELREKSKTSKWRRGKLTKIVRGKGRREVETWVKRS